MPTLDEVKKFLHIDYEDDDIYLQLLIDDAESFLIDAVDNHELKMSNSNYANKAKLVALTIINDAYSNKELVSVEQEKYRYLVGSMLLQMQYGDYGVEEQQ